MEILSNEEQITAPYPSQRKCRTVLLSMRTAGGNHGSEKRTV